MNKAEREIRNKEIRAFVEDHTYTEAAEKYDLSKNQIRKICKGLRDGYVNQYVNTNYDAEENARQLIEKANPNMEYISGFVNSNCMVTLRCKVCGSEFKKSMSTIRHGNKTRCPVCSPAIAYENAKKRKRAEAKRRRERLKPEIERRKAERHERAIINQALRAEEAKQKKEARRHDCPVCGKSTTRIKYCSDECANRANNARHEAARRARMISQMVDKDITLKRLFVRDRGQCWICGMMCDYKDKEERQGVVITGNLYPSIDHIVPLSDGGAHSWDNVKLAHRICNTDRYYAPHITA